MWSARGMRQSSPAQPWAASQLPPSDGWKGRRNWQVSGITASLCLPHMLYVCPLPLRVLAPPLWAKCSSAQKTLARVALTVLSDTHGKVIVPGMFRLSGTVYCVFSACFFLNLLSVSLNLLSCNPGSCSATHKSHKPFALKPLSRCTFNLFLSLFGSGIVQIFIANIWFALPDVFLEPDNSESFVFTLNHLFMVNTVMNSCAHFIFISAPSAGCRLLQRGVYNLGWWKILITSQLWLGVINYSLHTYCTARGDINFSHIVFIQSGYLWACSQIIYVLEWRGFIWLVERWNI